MGTGLHTSDFLQSPLRSPIGTFTEGSAARKGRMKIFKKTYQVTCSGRRDPIENREADSYEEAVSRIIAFIGNDKDRWAKLETEGEVGCKFWNKDGQHFD